MKYFATIFPLICLIGLDQIANAHRVHHKHPHEYNPAPSMNLTLCASKLDFLQLPNIYEQIVEYKSILTSVVESLKTRIASRLVLFKASRIEIKDNLKLLVSNEVAALMSQIVGRAQAQTQALVLQCLTNQRAEVQKLQTNAFAAIHLCYANNQLNETIISSYVTNLNVTALAVADRICECVKNISTCSTEEEKASAKACAQVSADYLNAASIQSSADSLYTTFDGQATATISRLESCFPTANITTPSNAIANAIIAC